jgi:hypothetical protein
MEYHSDKHLEWLAKGLIEGALVQFDAVGDVEILHRPESATSSIIQITLR